MDDKNGETSSKIPSANVQIKVSTWMSNLVNEMKRKSSAISIQKWVYSIPNSTNLSKIDIIDCDSISNNNNNNNNSTESVNLKITTKNPSSLNESITCDINQTANTNQSEEIITSEQHLDNDKKSLSLPPSTLPPEDSIIVSSPSSIKSNFETDRTNCLTSEISSNKKETSSTTTIVPETQIESSPVVTTAVGKFTSLSKIKITEFYDKFNLTKRKYNTFKNRKMDNILEQQNKENISTSAPTLNNCDTDDKDLPDDDDDDHRCNTTFNTITTTGDRRLKFSNQKTSTINSNNNNSDIDIENTYCPDNPSKSHNDNFNKNSSYFSKNIIHNKIEIDDQGTMDGISDSSSSATINLSSSDYCYLNVKDNDLIGDGIRIRKIGIGEIGRSTSDNPRLKNKFHLSDIGRSFSEHHDTDDNDLFMTGGVSHDSGDCSIIGSSGENIGSNCGIGHTNNNSKSRSRGGKRNINSCPTSSIAIHKNNNNIINNRFNDGFMLERRAYSVSPVHKLSGFNNFTISGGSGGSVVGDRGSGGSSYHCLSRDQSLSDQSNSHKNFKGTLYRDNSLQSDSSRCSSVESLLESRRPDPELILRNLGFGSVHNEDVLAKIPQRFLKQPSQARGIDTDLFVREQQLASNLYEQSVLGYRGLVGNPHIPPSVIVSKIMERFQLNDENRTNSVDEGLNVDRPSSAPPTPGPNLS